MAMETEVSRQSSWRVLAKENRVWRNGQAMGLERQLSSNPWFHCYIAAVVAVANIYVDENNCYVIFN